MTYHLSPFTPYVALFRDGKAVRLDGGAAFSNYALPRLFSGHDEEYAAIRRQGDGYIKAEDRAAFWEADIPEEDLRAGEYVAWAILNDLGVPPLNN